MCGMGYSFLARRYWPRANPRLSENRRFGSNSLRLPEEPVVTDALRNNAPVGIAA